MNTRLIQRFLATSALALAIPFSAIAQEAPDTAEDKRPPMGRQHHGKEQSLQHGHHGQHKRGGQHMMSLRGLKLSQAQKDQARALMDAGREAQRKQIEALQSARDALRKLSFSEQFDAARASELSKQIAEQESALLLARAEQGNKLYQILTPEQRKQLAERQNRPRKPA